MTPESTLHNFQGRLADYNARISALEHDRDLSHDSLVRVIEKIDKLQWWIMTTLAAAVGGILAQLAHR